MAQAHQQFAQAAILRLPYGQRLFNTGDARQLLARFCDSSRQCLPVRQAALLQLSLRLELLLTLPVQHEHHFVLELLQGPFQLAELGELGLGVGQTALQVLDLPRLFGELTQLPLHKLLQLGDLGPLAAELFVQPVDHLGQLCCVHVRILM